MSESGQTPQQKSGAHTQSGVRLMPATKAGSWALWMSAIGLASWVILPAITTIFREKYPITDSGLMPAIGAVLIDLAALSCVLALWRFRESSVLNIIAAALVIQAALMITLIVVGYAFGGS